MLPLLLSRSKEIRNYYYLPLVNGDWKPELSQHFWLSVTEAAQSLWSLWGPFPHAGISICASVFWNWLRNLSIWKLIQGEKKKTTQQSFYFSHIKFRILVCRQPGRAGLGSQDRGNAVQEFWMELHEITEGTRCDLKKTEWVSRTQRCLCLLQMPPSSQASRGLLPEHPARSHARVLVRGQCISEVSGGIKWASAQPKMNYLGVEAARGLFLRPY